MSQVTKPQPEIAIDFPPPLSPEPQSSYIAKDDLEPLPFCVHLLCTGTTGLSYHAGICGYGDRSQSLIYTRQSPTQNHLKSLYHLTKTHEPFMSLTLTGK